MQRGQSAKGQCWSRDMRVCAFYPVGIIEVQDPTPAGIDLFMTLPTGSHGQGGVHVNVMAGEVKTDESLEDDAPAWKGGSEEDEQAGGGTSISDHVQDCAKGG